MPQLMPLYWVYSMFMVSLVLLFLLVFFYNNIVDSMFYGSKLVLKKDKIWMW